MRRRVAEGESAAWRDQRREAHACFFGCGEASQVIDAIVCRGCFDVRNLASWLGIMVKASRT
jgi:hypothetical protein